MSLEGSLVLLLSLLLFAALAQSFRKGRSAPRGNQAERMLRIRAVAGNAGARYRLGVRCLERANDTAGFRWLMKSAEAGNAAAQDAVGMMYELGRGVSQDYGEAARWYEKAANRGFADSEVNLGNLYALGRGVEKDYERAVRWLEEAASKGGRQGRNSLAWLLATCPEDAIRNGRRAIDILSPIVNRGERNPILLDTLAAACAENGDFDAALRLVREAISKSDPGADTGLCEQMKRHATFYEMGKPWREPPFKETAGGDRGEPEAGIPEVPMAVEGEEPPADGHGPEGMPIDASLAQAAAGLEEGEGPQGGEDEADEQQAQSPLQPAGLPDEQTGTAEEGAVAPAHVDYIVEKLLVIEQLLRPLKAGEQQPPEEQAPSNGMTVPVGGDEKHPVSEEPLSSSSGGTDDTYQMALQFSDGFVAAVVEGDHKEVYAMMDATFRAAVPEGQMGPMLQQMFDAYGGKPIKAELKAKESGYRLHEGTQVRVHKFWYELQGSHYGKGDFTLFVETVPAGEGFACSVFFILPGRV